MTLVLRYAARSDRGLVRANNEDSVYAGARLLALADGMGGHAAGEVASQLMIAALAHLDDDEPGGDLLGKLEAATHEGNATIADHVEEDPELEGMGTTLTAILFAGSKLGLVHIGDSRAYLLRDDQLTQITRDDTFVQSLVDEGRITAEQAHTHPQRSLIMRAFRNTSGRIDPTLAPGDPDSLVPWSTLGAEGRRFVAGISDPRSVRTYVGLDSAPEPGARARLAVAELERAGGLRRAHVVVAVPTGSGWIDGEAARGLERRFAGDVAIVGMQYSYAPSWATFVFGRADAEASARALFAAVAARIGELPATERPALHVYGQSLGSIGGSAIFDDVADQRARTCSVLWAGPPAGSVRTDDATVLANSSDPVVWWSPALLTRAPDLTHARVDAPVPQWIPVVSFLQTGIDLVFALNAPSGHGHRYGDDQGLAMRDCG
ncbi:hypothetical protein GS438_12570 [Rhodococcus hoagii]|nr:hypothetical protein [Prescottella equi]